MCIVREMRSSTDHRMLKEKATNSYFTPVNEVTYKLLWDMFLSSSSSGSVKEPLSKVAIPVMMNRTFIIPYVLDRSCFLSFEDICETDKGAADFKAIADHFDTVFLHSESLK
jgi:predicted ATPase